ncbi:hypothetical protein GQ53DRAFT_379524 [Thozetella sp. PMI_491]|nr:hypothetical protein GQ53DRAFT_379524 [Thozetella sp. PMI_491]
MTAALGSNAGRVKSRRPDKQLPEWVRGPACFASWNAGGDGSWRTRSTIRKVSTCNAWQCLGEEEGSTVHIRTGLEHRGLGRSAFDKESLFPFLPAQVTDSLAMSCPLGRYLCGLPHTPTDAPRRTKLRCLPPSSATASRPCYVASSPETHSNSNPEAGPVVMPTAHPVVLAYLPACLSAFHGACATRSGGDRDSLTL